MSWAGAEPRGTRTSGCSPLAATDCKYDVSVQVDWGDRDDGTKRVPVTNFTVKANGMTLPFAGRSGETATYASQRRRPHRATRVRTT